MVIQFGYVTLFASAFPLSAAISVVCNFVEMKSDLFKLSFLTRRPRSVRVGDIGTWAQVLSAMSWLCLLTNTAIFAFSSEQVCAPSRALAQSGCAAL